MALAFLPVANRSPHPKCRLKALSFITTFALLSACSSGGSDSAPEIVIDPITAEEQRNAAWAAGVFYDDSIFENRCANPRAGTDDIQGTVLDENNWLRSYTNDTYLWYDEIVDQDPGNFTDPQEYFATLRTTEITPSGKFKDEFSFSQSTESWLARQQGISAGYGFTYSIISATVPREAVLVNASPDTPATAEGVDMARADSILAIDGVDFVNASTQEEVDVLNAGLIPASIGETHTFTILDASTNETRTVTLTSEQVFTPPVQNTKIIETASGTVGYLTFFAFNSVSEAALYDAFLALASANVSDLIIDLRYNGGGLSAISSQLAYMIAGNENTANRIYKIPSFNDKHQEFDPVTLQRIEAVPFYNLSGGFGEDLGANVVLPSLNLDRVFILSGSNTCSASESLMNGLTGIDFEVILIGETSCGKPYGFYTLDNCGVTYFPVQIQNQNAKGFGDYADGFSAVDSSNQFGVLLPGCSVPDDLSKVLGDETEGRLSTALYYLENGSCPAGTKAFGAELNDPNHRGDGQVPTYWHIPKVSL